MAIADDITEIEKKLVQLKSDYEQYFTGLQKRAPERLRADVERLIQFYSNQRITNTALNFRYKTVVAKYNSYKSYWDRVLREIEEGRYVRDLFRMKLHDRMKEEASPRPARLETERKEAPLSEEEYIKKVYYEYVEARRMTNEPPVKYESVANLIRAQTPVIKEKYKASTVEFKVAVEGGKAKLKAVPKK